MDDPRVSRVLNGDLRDLPPVYSQVVRIFTSSTFTDTIEERNSLMESVYPRIQKYCRSQYGLEFQVVDMRWGVRDEATDDHQVAQLCLDEIHTCQRLSIGPNFVAFLGQRHGHRPFPPVIDGAEFSLLLGELRAQAKDTQTLEEWFIEDRNAIPTNYVLQPISNRIPAYLSTEPDKKKQAQRQWNADFGRMQRLLRQAAKACADAGTISEAKKNTYFMSVTESEIHEGIFRAAGDPNEQCLCFVRIIVDMKLHLAHSKAWRFIDMVESRVDEEAQDLLTRLRDERLAAVLKDRFKFNVTWSDDGGIARTSHQEYIQKFNDLFYLSVKRMIDRGVTVNQELARNELYLEVLQHLHAANARCQGFHGRVEVLQQIEELVTSGTDQPIVVFGASGCGKTSVMAKCANLIRDWLPSNSQPVVVLRLLGTSPLSTGLRQALLSVCQQITTCYKVINFQTPEDFNTTVKAFHELLHEASESKPLVLLLDSLDQLTSRNYAFRLGWLPRSLPKHVTMLVSTLPDLHGILDILRKRTLHTNFVDVPGLGGQTSVDILTAWLESNNRRLTDSQMSLAKEAFSRCNLALYVKLVFEEVLAWRSYTDASQTRLAYTIRETIINLFSRLKRKYGERFVTHSLGYVTASRAGLSETELADLLSLDDDVLTDVFQYHTPPVRRIPQLLWLRLKNDVSSYLVNRESDGTSVIYWYHRQFREAAAKYFLEVDEFHTMLHSRVADYFIGRWHGKKKPYTYNAYLMGKLGLSSPHSAADRKVAPQPLIYTSDEKEGHVDTQTRYNLRKLNNLPYHMINGNRSQEFKSNYMYSYHWLYIKICACSVQAVLSDFDLLAKLDQFDTSLKNVLQMSKSTLNKNPTTLSLEITGSLLPTAPQGSDLWGLIDQCYREGVRDNALVARQHCYNVPGGPLVYTLEHPSLPDREKALVLLSTATSPSQLNYAAILAGLTREHNILIVWDLDDGEVKSEFKLWPEKEPRFNVIQRSFDGSQVVCGCAHQTDVNPIVIYDVESDDISLSLVLDKVYPKVGFVESFQIGLTKNRIVINVCGREADCFDLQGHMIHSFDVVASSMHIYTGTEVLFTLKGEMSIQSYNIENCENNSSVSLQRKPNIVALSPDGEKCFVTETGHTSIEYVARNASMNAWAVIGTLDLGKYLGGSIKDIQVFSQAEADYLLINTGEDFILWNITKRKFFRRFLIPDHVKPKTRVLGFTGKLTHRNRTLLCIYEGFILVWDVQSGLLVQTLQASRLLLSDLLVIPESGIFVTATSRNRIIKVWDVHKAYVDTFHPLSLEAAGRHSRMSTNSHMLALRSHDPTETRVIDVQKGKIISAPSKQFEAMEPLISPDGTRLVLRDFNTVHGVRVWSAETGEILQEVPVHQGQLKWLTVSSNFQMLATHSETSHTQDVQTVIWDLNTGESRLTVRAKEGGISVLFFTGSDQFLVTCQRYPYVQTGLNAVIHVYSVDTGEEVMTRGGIFAESQVAPIPNSPYVLAIEAGPDGNQREEARYIVLGIPGGEVIARTNRTINRLSFTMSMDGTTLVDYDIRIIDVMSGETVWDLSEHMPKNERIGPQVAPRVTQDGKYIVWTVLSEGVLKVGKLEDKSIIGTCYVHSQPASLAISFDNIVSVFCDDGRVMLLQITDGQTEGCSRVLDELLGLHSTLAGPTYRDFRADRAPRAASCVCVIL